MTIKKASIILAIAALAVFSLLAFLLPRDDKSEYVTEIARKKSIVQTVSETGTIKAAKELELSFPNSGKIDKINVNIGDEARPGMVLAELDKGNLEIKRQEAQANLDVANSNLDKLLAGATKEEIAVKQAGVDQAKTAYDSARQEYEKIKASLEESVAQAQKNYYDLSNNSSDDITGEEQAVASAEDNLKNTKSTYLKSIDDNISSSLLAIEEKMGLANTALDNVNRVATDEDGEDLLGKQDPKYLANAVFYYNISVNLLSSLQENYEQKKADKEKNDVLELLSGIDELLNNTYLSLFNCYKALENSVTSSSFTQSAIDSFKTSISSQQTLVTSAISSIESSEQSLNSAILTYETKVSAADNSLKEAKAALRSALDAAKNALTSAELSRDKQLASAQAQIDSSYKAWQLAAAQLEALKAPANIYDVSLAKAQVRQAEASLDTANKQVEDSLLRAPYGGVATKINYEPGEQVSGGQSVIALLSSGEFEIEVLISEADIAKVKIGDASEVTLDAYGEDIKFGGKVKFIEPAETEIQDVVYYQADIIFDPEDYGIKPGMTANVMITTAQKDDVLTVPYRAVIDKNGLGKFVRLLVDGSMQEVKVATGLKGDEGNIEILSGLKGGETVITYIKEKE